MIHMLDAALNAPLMAVLSRWPNRLHAVGRLERPAEVEAAARDWIGTPSTGTRVMDAAIPGK